MECPGPLQYLKIAPRFSADAVDARSPETEMVMWTVHFLLIPACLLEDCAAERPFSLVGRQPDAPLAGAQRRGLVLALTSVLRAEAVARPPCPVVS